MITIEYTDSVNFTPAEIFGVRCMFTILRVNRKTLPKGVYCYDIRHSDENWGMPCTVEPHVLVNHYGTIITRRELIFPDQRDRYLLLNNSEETDDDDFIIDNGIDMSIEDFLNDGNQETSPFSPSIVVKINIENG